MQERTRCGSRALAVLLMGPALLLVLFVLPALPVAAQTLTLAQLPYEDPRPLDQVLALDERRFGEAMMKSWPQLQKMFARYIPAGVTVDAPSLFFRNVSTSCLIARQAWACRLYADFLSFLMTSRQPVASPAPLNLPVLMRPAQLPWRDTAVLNAMLLLDAAQLQSALSARWDWVHGMILRYLPDHVDLHPVSKVFTNVRTTCQTTQSEVACRAHLADIDSLVDGNRGAPRTTFLRLDQIPYRDPAPLDVLLQLAEPQLRGQLAGNWPQIDRQLDLYISRQTAIVDNKDFARSRIDCQDWFPGDYFMCRTYISNLANLMRSKRGLASPARSASH